MVFKAQRNNSGDGSMPAQFHFQGAAREVTSDWLRADQHGVYWSHCVQRLRTLCPLQPAFGVSQRK